MPNQDFFPFSPSWFLNSSFPAKIKKTQESESPQIPIENRASSLFTIRREEEENQRKKGFNLLFLNVESLV
jgi:hypothetical protein